MNKSIPKRLCALLLCGLSAALLGCSQSHELETAPVHGIVTFNGQPLEAGEVAFVPTKGRGATARIAADGTYTLGTYHDGDGALVGMHTVTVYPRYAVHEKEAIKVGVRMVPQPVSGIEATVKPGIENEINLNLPLK